MSDSGLAIASNITLVLAIAAYGVAMVAYAFDLAARARRQAAAADAAPARAGTPALVGAAAGVAAAGELPGPSDGPGPGKPGTTITGSGGPAMPGGPAGPGGSVASAARTRWPASGWARAGFVLTCLGLASHVASITMRGIDEHRVPWGNMYEFIAAITCAAVLVLVLASARFGAYYLGLFVLLPVVLALAVDVMVIYTPAGNLVPALQSYWIAIHVTAMIVALGLYIFGAVVTVLYLLAARSERMAKAGGRPGGGIMAQLPGSQVLDRLSYRSVLFAFPAWTFAIIAGAIWADHAWGRYWGWDPKETWSFITWLVYAAYLHARATAGWRGHRAAVIHLAGFACLLFNVVVINLWVTGLHSYAGMH